VAKPAAAAKPATPRVAPPVAEAIDTQAEAKPVETATAPEAKPERPQPKPTSTKVAAKAALRVTAKAAASSKPVAAEPAEPKSPALDAQPSVAAPEPVVSAPGSVVSAPEPKVAAPEPVTAAQPATVELPAAELADTPVPVTAVAETQTKAPAPPRPAAPMNRASPPPRAPAKAEVFVEGDHVVYPTHGVGKVERIAVEEIAGHKLELIHITFEENRMTLRVPVSKARSAGLRKLATRKLFEEALNVLRGRARIKRTMWSRRAQEYEAKINSGDPLAIAEVVRDLHRNAGQPDQSFSERQIYEAAMDRLAAELAALDKTDKLTAASKLSEFLKTV
jgi:CarD family transcriptional regulator